MLLRKIKITGAATAAPLFIGGSVGEVLEVPADLAAKAVGAGVAEYVTEEAPKEKKAIPPATTDKKQ